jgi:adenylate cyclase
MMVVAPVLLLVAQVHSLREEPRWALAFHAYAGILFGLLFLALTPPSTLAPYVVMCVAVFVLSGFIARHAATATRERLRELAHLNLLKRFLPATAVERVMTESGTLPTLESREVLLTVVSTDLRGFTSLIERLDPPDAIAQLNEYHSAMVDVIARHGGIVDKFIGDGALVVFGLGGEGEEASFGAMPAIACALEMRERLDTLNRERSADGRVPLRMGIGIHTGRVVCGCLGSGARIELTIIGDTVNTAARLEALTKQTDTVIVLSEETRRLADTRAPFVDLGLRTLPGKSDPVRVFGLG